MTYDKKIFEFDEFLPAWLTDAGEVQFYRFPFEYNHHVYSNSNPFFGKLLFNNSTGVNIPGPYIIEYLIDCLKYDLLKQMDPEATFISLERIIVNGQTPNQKPEAHVDYNIDPNIWTMVYYVNESNGGTIFYDSDQNQIHRSEYKKGKAVIFQSNMLHQAEQTTADWRVSIGISFRIDSNLNLQST